MSIAGTLLFIAARSSIIDVQYSSPVVTVRVVLTYCSCCINCGNLINDKYIPKCIL